MENLQHEVYNESDMLQLLGIAKSQLDYLRHEKSFPYVNLGRRVRVYLAEQVWEYIQSYLPRTKSNDR